MYNIDMLRTREKEARKQIRFVCIEDLVPQDHLLRKIENVVDFSFVRDEVKELYSEDKGRPSVDPVTLVKRCVINYLCPDNRVMEYATTNREGYREYKSKSESCKSCPYLERCTLSAKTTKVVTRHIWEDYLERVEDNRHTERGRWLYERRKETIERVFADGKEKHGLRYTRYNGLAKVRTQVMLTFMVMNLKKLAKLLGGIPLLLRAYIRELRKMSLDLCVSKT